MARHRRSRTWRASPEFRQGEPLEVFERNGITTVFYVYDDQGHFVAEGKAR